MNSLWKLLRDKPVRRVLHRPPEPAQLTETANSLSGFAAYRMGPWSLGYDNLRIADQTAHDAEFSTP